MILEWTLGPPPKAPMDWLNEPVCQSVTVSTGWWCRWSGVWHQSHPAKTQVHRPESWWNRLFQAHQRCHCHGMWQPPKWMNFWAVQKEKWPGNTLAQGTYVQSRSKITYRRIHGNGRLGSFESSDHVRYGSLKNWLWNPEWHFGRWICSLKMWLHLVV